MISFVTGWFKACLNANRGLAFGNGAPKMLGGFLDG